MQITSGCPIRNGYVPPQQCHNAFDSVATFIEVVSTRDYTHISGHVDRSSAHPRVTNTTDPVVIGSAEDGGGGDDGGDDGSGEEGGDGGDGEPPIPADFASGGDGQHPILLLLLLLLLGVCLLFDLVVLPFAALRRLLRLVPSLRTVWVCGQYLFLLSVRTSTYRPELRSLLRDRRWAKRRPLPFRVWMGFCLRIRTLVLLLRCVAEMLKGIGLRWRTLLGT